MKMPRMMKGRKAGRGHAPRRMPRAAAAAAAFPNAATAFPTPAAMPGADMGPPPAGGDPTMPPGAMPGMPGPMGG